MRQMVWRKRQRWCWGMKGRGRKGNFFWCQLEKWWKWSQATYLGCMDVFNSCFLRGQKASQCLCDVWFNHTFACWRHPKRTHVHVCTCVCKREREHKQIKPWVSDLFQKSDAGLMHLPCGQRIWSFFHYLWWRNTFECLPPSLLLSLFLSLSLPGGRRGCWFEKRCIQEAFQQSGNAALEFRNHKVYLVGTLNHREQMISN